MNYYLLLFGFFIFFASNSEAKIGLQIQSSYFQQNFNSESSSGFGSIENPASGYSFYLNWKNWVLTLSNEEVSPFSIDSFVFTDGQSGTFYIGYQTQSVLFGRKFMKITPSLVFGNIKPTWEGNLETHAILKTKNFTGIDLKYDFWEKSIIRLALWMRYLKLENNAISFADFPLDSLQFKSNTAWQGGISLAFEFF